MCRAAVCCDGLFVCVNWVKYLCIVEGVNALEREPKYPCVRPMPRLY